MKIIRCTVKKPARKRYEPETPFWKGLSDSQRKAYIASLDDLDKRAIKSRTDYKFS